MEETVNWKKGDPGDKGWLTNQNNASRGYSQLLTHMNSGVSSSPRVPENWMKVMEIKS